MILTLKEIEQIKEWLDIDKHKRVCPFGDLPERSYNVYRSHFICQLMFPTLSGNNCPCYQFPMEQVEVEALEAVRKGIVE